MNIENERPRKLKVFGAFLAHHTGFEPVAFRLGVVCSAKPKNHCGAWFFLINATFLSTASALQYPHSTRYQHYPQELCSIIVVCQLSTLGVQESIMKHVGELTLSIQSSLLQGLLFNQVKYPHDCCINLMCLIEF